MTSDQQVPPVRDRSRLQSAAKIVVFDIAGPLVAYSLLRSAGLSSVLALVLSGAFPALGIVAGLARNRRVDAIGVLVLAGIAVGTVLGLVTGNARLVLVEGSVPTAVFGLLCLGSLWSRRPLIFRFALEFMGADTPRGRDFEGLWRYEGFRHAFRLFTVVWGVVVPGRSGGSGHHRRDDLDGDRADRFQGDALRRRRRARRLDDHLWPAGQARRRTACRRGRGRARRGGEPTPST